MGAATTTTDDMQGSVLVLGAGMVGVACALELQRRGFEVVLADAREPGSETSHGNAGVLTRSSIVPLNNPALWRSLPGLLSNESASLRYDRRYLLRNLGWAARFLLAARPRAFERTVAALDQLIGHSMREHERLLAESAQGARLRRDGWMFLYRNAVRTPGMRLQLEVYRRCGVDVEELDAAAIRALEPALRPIFPRGLLIRAAHSVDDPGAVVRGYAELFQRRGASLLRRRAVGLSSQPGGWSAHFDDGSAAQAAHVVIALGPWSAAFLRGVGLRIPMAFERGYHMHYAGGAPGAPALTRPIHDAHAGYVLSPMRRGLRLSTGVELDELDAPPRQAQLERARQAAAQALDLGEALDPSPWKGARPTLPDSRPMIGELPLRGLWAAFGHQHIGFSTGPGSASLLGALMAGEPAPIDPAPFAPQRFAGLRRAP